MENEKFWKKERVQGVVVGAGVALLLVMLLKGCSGEQGKQEPLVVPQAAPVVEDTVVEIDTTEQQQEEIGISNPMEEFNFKKNIKETLPSAVDNTIENVVEGAQDSKQIFHDQLNKYDKEKDWNKIKEGTSDWANIGGGFYKKTKGWLKEKSK